MSKNNYEPYYAVEAEGYRIGLMVCKHCGAAILVAKDTTASIIHDKWHNSMEKKHLTKREQLTEKERVEIDELMNQNTDKLMAWFGKHTR